MSLHGSFFDDTALPGLTGVFFGQVATFTPVSGGPVSCDVVITRDVVVQPMSYGATTVLVGDTIEALVDQVGDISEGDVFTIDGTDFACKRELDNNGRITRWVIHGV